jgi:hypothetical protein
MKTAFKEKQLRKPSFLQRLFKQEVDSNAVIQINNILATNSVLSITPDNVNSILGHYKSDILKVYGRNFIEFYGLHLIHCLEDLNLCFNDKKELEHLQLLFQIDRSIIAKAHTIITSDIFEQKVKSIISSGRLSDNDEMYLRELSINVNLSPDNAKRILETEQAKFLQTYIDKILKEEMFSPDNVSEFDKMQEAIKYNLKLDESTVARLDRYKLYWHIDYGDIPQIAVDIKLTTGEVCYCKSSANWKELCKEKYYDVNNKTRYRYVWKTIEFGRLYLTNKKLLFIASDKKKNIPFDKIISSVMRREGLMICKNVGKDVLLDIDNDSDLFERILTRLK